MQKISGIITLIRPDLAFAAGLCVILGQLLALGKPGSIPDMLTGFFTVFCIAGAILVMNDCLDAETDRINSPSRPIPSGKVTKTEAAAFSAGLFLTGFVLSFLHSLAAFVIIFILSIVGILYNRNFKQTGITGNIMVSFSVGMTFLYGGVTVHNPFDKTVIFFAVITALIDLGEEIAADSMDIEGDRLIHSRSLAIRFGRQKALNISSLIFAAVVLITIIPLILNWFSVLYAVPILLIDSIIIYAVSKLRNSDNGSGRVYIKYIYRGGTIGLLLFMVMKLAGI